MRHFAVIADHEPTLYAADQKGRQPHAQQQGGRQDHEPTCMSSVIIIIIIIIIITRL
jgi:hypothetical protein